MRINCWAGLATVMLAGVMATTAFAQAPGGGGRGGGRGFGGGFGSMPGIQLVGIAAVQKDLGVTDDVAAKLKTVSEEAMAEMRPAGGGGGGAGGGRGTPPTDEERAARNAKRAEVIAKYKPKLAEVLSTAQVERLNQIELQGMRSQVYSDPTVVKTLSLSKDQQDKLASINKEYGEKQREMFAGGGGGGGDREERMAKMRTLAESHEKDLAAVLTSDQQKQLASLKGKEFDLSQLMGGFGGGGGRGGRPGGNRPAQ